ncbi:MAG TPA: wax ester/triacylglycerol synthase domain-containing protein [Acidimicrobiales bacterium]|nr:wax ester/triacylglycerol synthase domain-containing protein [Acidimicrobiales bacterium]
MAPPETAFMRASDAFSWYMERDPVLRSTIVAVAWLDSGPDWDALQQRMARAVDLVPSLRARPLVPPMRLSTPRWTLDPDFDLSWHLRRVAAPAPANPETVVDMARKAATTAFDPAHPLWEFTLVEGLDDDRTALVMKIHHSLTDGVGGMQLAMVLFDLSASASLAETTFAPGATPEYPEGDGSGRRTLAITALAHSGRIVVDTARRQAIGALPTFGRATRHPSTTAGDVLGILGSTARMVAPVRSTLSPVMVRRGLGRHLAMIRVGLDDLHGAATAAGGTLNDAFVAALTGGLRLYHELHASHVDELRMTLPISTRKADDPIAGDRITLLRFAVPVGVADPADRIRATGARCRAARAECAIPYTNTIAGFLNLLPASTVGSMLKCVDFLASNVPGMPYAVYLAGARMSGYFAFSPTIGAALNATLISYNGECCVGVNIDTDAVSDPESLLGCLHLGFDEVLGLSEGASTPARR